MSGKSSKAQFPVSGIFPTGGILDNEKLLSRNNLFNFKRHFLPRTMEFPPARKIALTGNQP